MVNIIDTYKALEDHKIAFELLYNIIKMLKFEVQINIFLQKFLE